LTYVFSGRINAAMEQSMTFIELPYPPKQLMPNFKRSHHWTAYSKQSKNARTLAWGLTAQELGPKLRQYEAPNGLEIRITVAPPMRGGPVADEDNLKGALKHYLDGISDALGVNDRLFRFAAIEWLPKSGAGRVIISF
jgi:crossover junction endodeoxyribonuclease RusA